MKFQKAKLTSNSGTKLRKGLKRLDFPHYLFLRVLHKIAVNTRYIRITWQRARPGCRYMRQHSWLLNIAHTRVLRIDWSNAAICIFNSCDKTCTRVETSCKWTPLLIKASYWSINVDEWNINESLMKQTSKRNLARSMGPSCDILAILAHLPTGYIIMFSKWWQL